MRNHYFKNSVLRFWLILALMMWQGLPVSSAFAQSLADTMSVEKEIQTSESSAPSLLTGLTIDTNNPLKLNFIVDLGDSHLEGKKFESEAKRLIKYFLTALTVPEEELWVNLSPYEKNRIVPDKLGQTEMGQNLLGQDYLLKQLTASLINPEEKLGQDFWKKVRNEAFKVYGTTEIPVNTFNRVWIVPDKAVIYEKWPTAMVVDTHLKVLLEEDYQALNTQQTVETMASRGTLDAHSDIASSVLREIIIPAIEKEVNEGKSFESLRQIYHSMILATWFKQKLKASLLGQIYVDQNKVKGIDNAEKQMKEKIYQQYLETFQKGVFNTIREEYDPHTDQMIPRKYMAGGWSTRNPVDGLNLAQRVSSQIIESEKGLSLKSSKALESGNKKSVDVLLLENADDAVASLTNEQVAEIEKNILAVLEHTDYSFEQLRQQDIDDLVILGNDNLDVFREALRLWQGGVGQRIYIAGGYGRLTLPLIDSAVKAGFRIKISERQIVDIEQWQAIREAQDETQIRGLVEQSEAQIIKQILLVMIAEEDEFVNLRSRLSKTGAEAIVSEPREEKLENNSKHTFANLVLYRKFLLAQKNIEVDKEVLKTKGRRNDKKPFKSLFLQTPHQEWRSILMVYRVFAAEINRDLIQGFGYAISYQIKGKLPGEVFTDILGELWRVIMNAEKGDAAFPLAIYPQGFASIPSDLWLEGRQLFAQLSDDQKKIFANDMMQVISPFGIDVQNLSDTITEDAKAFVADIVSHAETSIKGSSGIITKPGGGNNQDTKYGGINLDPRYLNLQINRDGQGIPLPLIQQPVNRMHIEGFLPIIINIAPVNIPNLLSENLKAQSQDLQLVNN